ncbi:MAG: hypothetical protein IT580_22010, partial [Verrucomicrobiales bacterium]|nr:hypothetical protein [Verrucomicrobiales bacterium]
MTEALLKSQLAPVLRRQKQVRFWRRVGLGGVAAAGVVLGILVLQVAVGGVSPWWKTMALALGMATMVVLMLRRPPGEPDSRSAALLVESRFPELKGLVLTAVQQVGAPGAPLNYLQRCLLRDAVVHSRTHDWPSAAPSGPVILARVLGVLGIAALV